jgi:serine/threonine protein kinase
MKICPQCDTGYPDNAVTCPTHGGLLSEILDLRSGMLIRKTYRIERLLGKGGMGSVYLARHELMDALRALKFLSHELNSDEAFTRRFLREGRMLRQVRHKNVVDCGDLERAEDDRLFFAMEFVDGPDLRGLMHHAHGRLDVAEALAITRGIAEGLGAAHALGMVHRDIKPENVLMARDKSGWVPKIADFGIVATVESSTVYKTTHGSLLTPPYAAPEQWRGMRASELDGRTDLYALGGVFFEMLTGQTVFVAENYEGWLFQHLQTPPRSPSSLRPELAGWKGLDALVLRLLAKDREDRPRDIAELLGLLDAVRPTVPERQPTVLEIRKATVIEPEPARPTTTPIPHPEVKPKPEEPAEQVARLSPDAGPDAEVEKPRRGPKWIPEATIVAAVLIVFFVSWQESRNRDSILSTETPTQTASGTESQPAVGTGTSSSESSQDPIYQQAKTLSDQGLFRKAIPLFDQSCKAGDAQACNDLGHLYDWAPHFSEADSVTQDYPRALKLLTKACDAGNADGCTNLGSLYDLGRGVSEDFTRAAALYTKGCDGNNATACNNLGVALMFGSGVTEDKEKARQVLQKSCSLGDQSACEWLKKL